VAHTFGVTTFDRDFAPSITQTSPVVSDAGADICVTAHERRRKPSQPLRIGSVQVSMLEPKSRALLVSTQLIDAACRARDGDCEGAKAHIARAIALLDGHPGMRTGGQNRECGKTLIPRGGFAAWQSRRLAAHVNANLADKISVKALAASLDISVGHFCRAFKCTFGMPARRWILHRRIELAQGLMLTKDASLSEIALSCGMSDQSHFTRVFRRLVGETPSSWRHTRHSALEDRATDLAYAGQTRRRAVEAARRLGRP
jgi:AraC family transcriptional regulator